MKMRRHARLRWRGRQEQGGYAILLVLFMATLMLLATMVAAPNLLTEGRREREKELIWRGKQYSRGVKLYYRKTGKFPHSLDDLVKPQVGNVRFMRQAYKDPMNTENGEWRLIYVGPAGQLIGSLKPQRALQLSGLGFGQQVTAPTIGGPLNASVTNPFGQGGGQQPSGSPFGQRVGGVGNAAATQPGQPANSASADASVPASATTGGDVANDALLASDTPVILGGNIIGVGSKVNRKSIIVYDQATNYRQFEFIWDPSRDAIVLGGSAGPQNGLIPGTQQPGALQPQGSPLGTSGPQAPGTAPSQTPTGGFPGNPGNPPPMPPETTPNPPQP